MPSIPLTTAGENRLLSGGAEPTHLQFGSTTLPEAEWAARTTVPGAFKAIPVTEAVVGSELQLDGVDDDDSAEYTNFACLGAWIGDPSNPGSILMAFGTAATGMTYGDKVLNIDLQVSATIALTAAQQGNVTLSISVLLNATETRFGKARRATETEAEGGANNVGFMTALRTQNWWDALWATLAINGSKLVNNSVTSGKILSLSASKLTGTIASARFGANTVMSSHIVSLSASKLTGTIASARFGANTVMSSHIVSLAASKLTGIIDLDRIPALPASKFPVATVALTDAATIAWDLDGGQLATATLAGNRTLSVPTNGLDNTLYLLRVTQDSTGSRTLTLDDSIERGDLPDPTLSTDANSTDVLGFMKWGGTVHYMGILNGY